MKNKYGTDNLIAAVAIGAAAIAAGAIIVNMIPKHKNTIVESKAPSYVAPTSSVETKPITDDKTTNTKHDNVLLPSIFSCIKDPDQKTINICYYDTNYSKDNSSLLMLTNDFSGNINNDLLRSGFTETHNLEFEDVIVPMKNEPNVNVRLFWLQATYKGVPTYVFGWRNLQESKVGAFVLTLNATIAFRWKHDLSGTFVDYISNFNF